MSTDHSVSLTYSAMMSVVTEKQKTKKTLAHFFFHFELWKYLYQTILSQI